MLTRHIVLVLPVFLIGCSATPRSYLKQRHRLDCKYVRDCNTDEWDRRGYENVRECWKDNLSEGEIDDFVDACDDYNPGEAAQCLNGHRAIHRDCDLSAASKDEARACGKVCDGDSDDDDDGWPG